MALLTAGYWQTTYFPSNYWQEDYWPEYGAPREPVPSVAAPRRRIMRRTPPVQEDPYELFSLWLQLQMVTIDE